MATNNAESLDQECLHCRHSNGNDADRCCEAAAFDESVIRYLPLLAANDFLE